MTETTELISGREPIDLSRASQGNFRRTRPRWIEALWILIEILIMRNPIQPFTRPRAWMLRAFGARIGTGVILRPGLRVKFPWLLEIGDRSWVGEDVWIHNQAQLAIEDDVVVSQGTFISTGSHEFRTNMDLTVAPIRIRRGAWITSRCTILRGVEIGENVVVTPGSVIHTSVPADAIVGGMPAKYLRNRWESPTGSTR